MGMHDRPFLVVFDINEDLKFTKNYLFRGGEYHSYWNVHVLSFLTNLCGITSNFAMMFSIDLFCCIRLCATVPLLLYCVQGVSNIDRSSSFLSIIF